jgi:single-strand selective monofunctional uracil DNA glycosylase
MPENLTAIAADLSREAGALSFGPPVSCVYNPLQYAWRPHALYLNRYGAGSREIVLLGMNPGVWGMVQTGVPFGEVELVRNWLGIEAELDLPEQMHPKRPIHGFQCRRREVSGRRLWGWARDRFGNPEKFFGRFFVVNYCPLCFLEASGRNRTPDKLPRAERDPLFAVCDRALYRSMLVLSPSYVVGIGKFAADRAAAALQELEISVGCVTHPSPANPKAGRNWGAVMDQDLAALGIAL